MVVEVFQGCEAGRGVEIEGLGESQRGVFMWGKSTLVMRSEKSGVMGMLKAGAEVKGSSCRVYLQVYARDFCHQFQGEKKLVPYVDQGGL